LTNNAFVVEKIIIILFTAVEITVRLFTTSNQQYNVNEEIAKATADAIWNTTSTTRSIRDCVRSS
jgi:cell division protein FtsL